MEIHTNMELHDELMKLAAWATEHLEKHVHAEKHELHGDVDIHPAPVIK